jgi:hypothetical protein
MTVGVLSRIRHYKDRFRYLNRTWLDTVHVPGSSIGLAAGTGTLTFTEGSKNVDTQMTVYFTVDATPGVVVISIAAGLTPATLGDAVQAALNADAALTATDDNAGVVTVTATSGTLNAISFSNPAY